jgi:serine phosphatase RsbU (regulator of sigma subunit)
VAFGLAIAFWYATKLSSYGADDAQHAFTYQSAVIAAQHDTDLLQINQFEHRAKPAERIKYEHILRGDLEAIDRFAETRGERAPHIKFPASREDFDNLAADLDVCESLGIERFYHTVGKNRDLRNVSNALFAFIALVFALLAGRLGRALDERRSLVERLQRAFISQRRELPNLDLGSVLISATRGSNVGGDTHDAFTLDNKTGMFFVADVSGKGIDAAVDTALIKYTLRTLFSEMRDPGLILEKFASLYARTALNPETFVVLFLGVIDLESGSVRYASAGHETAWSILGPAVSLLGHTGPIVGIEADSHYETRGVQLRYGDAIVVSTDGLSESRDARGELLGVDRVTVWLSELSGGAQNIADSIVRRLRRRSRRITDDLAILVVRYVPIAMPGTAAAERDAAAPEAVLLGDPRESPRS